MDSETTLPAQPEAPAIPGVTRWRNREPVIVDAIQWTGGNEEAIAAFVGEVNASSEQVGFKTWDQPGFTVIRSTVDENFIAQLWNSAQGSWVGVMVGWYVVRGITGHFFTLAAEQFADVYEPASGPLVMPADEFAVLRTVARELGMPPPSPAPAGPSASATGPAEGGEDAAIARQLVAQAKAADDEYKVAAVRATLYEFLHQYGHSMLPTFKVAIDLAVSLRKIIDDLGGEEPGDGD